MNRTVTIATVVGLAVGTGVLLGLIVRQLRKSAIRPEQVAQLPDTEMGRRIQEAIDRPPETWVKRERPKRKLEVDESNPLFTREH